MPWSNVWSNDLSPSFAQSLDGVPAHNVEAAACALLRAAGLWCVTFLPLLVVVLPEGCPRHELPHG